MALQKKSLGVVESSIPAVKSIESTHNKVVEFGTNSTDGLTLPVGTPVAFDEDNGNWIPWDVTGAGTVGDGFKGVIRGFVYPEPIVLDDADTVLGVVMFSGRIGWDDITKSATYNPGYTEAALKAALQGDWATVDAEVAAYAAAGNANTPRALGLIIEDVPDIAR